MIMYNTVKAKFRYGVIFLFHIILKTSFAVQKFEKMKMGRHLHIFLNILHFFT